MAEQNVPRSLSHLNRRPEIRENREAAGGTSLAPRIRVAWGSGPVVLKLTASKADRAPADRFNMGSGKDTQPFWFPQGPSLWL